MWSISLSLLVVYFGFYLFIVFLSLSIACGLYYLAEVIEEFTVTAKRLIGYMVKAEVALHILLLIDRLPFYCIALGIASHIFYARLLKRFPYMQFMTLDGLFAALTFLGSNIAWALHFWRAFYTVEYIAAFLLVTTWIIPTTFFLSAAGDQAVLPGGAHGSYGYSSPMMSTPSPQKRTGLNGGGDDYTTPASRGNLNTGQQQRARRSLALKVFDMIRRKRDEVVPDMLAKLPASSGLIKEKV